MAGGPVSSPSRARAWASVVWQTARSDPASAITLCASATLGAFAVFGVLDSVEALTGATLGTLALVAASLLVEGTRRRAAEDKAIAEGQRTRQVVERVSEELTAVSEAVKMSSGVRIYRQETDEAREHQLRIIRDVGPAKVRMWEHSAFTARFVIEALVNCDRFQELQLLVARPDKVSRWHRDYRIRPTIEEIIMLIRNSRREDISVEIRCYAEPSVRGRNFDDRFVAVGWYTFDYRPNLRRERPHVWGAHNAVTIVNCATPAGAALRGSFNEAFDGTWDEAVSIKEALEPYLDEGSDPDRYDLVSGAPGIRSHTDAGLN